MIKFQYAYIRDVVVLLASFTIRGFTVKLLLDSKVYRPSYTTKLIAESLPDLSGLYVLDLGTGSGILSIIASMLGARKIIATDISRRALKNASENLKYNNIDNVELRLGDLYEPVYGESFDVIISNPPMTPSPTPLPSYTWGGVDGRRILDAVIKNSVNYLKSNGRLIIPTISIVGIEKTSSLLRDLGFKVKVLGYGYHSFGRILLKLKEHIDRLPSAEYFYDVYGRPCWRLVVYEASVR